MRAAVIVAIANLWFAAYWVKPSAFPCLVGFGWLAFGALLAIADQRKKAQ